jgi:hypothetical protein
MPDLSELVTPKSVVPPVAPETEVPASAPEAAPEAPQLPDELLQIPALQGLLTGAPPAVSMKIKDFNKTEGAKLIKEHKDELLNSGIQFYRSLSGDTGVMFNALYINGEDIKAADKAGKLPEVAPPVDTVNAQISKMGMNEHPTLNFKGSPGGLAGPGAPLPPQSANSPMPMPTGSPGVNRDRLMAQIANIKPGAPTTGPKPGAGRLLNSILKPVL